MLRAVLTVLALVIPAAVVLAAPGVAPPGSLDVSTDAYEARLAWPAALAQAEDQATLTIDAAGRHATMTLRAVHVAERITQSTTPLRPFLVGAEISSGEVPTALLTYDFASTGAIAETRSTLLFEFHDDRIVYTAVMRVPNVLFASHVREETALGWGTPWSSSGVILANGTTAPGNGVALANYQRAGNTGSYGVYFDDGQSAIAQVRLASGSDVNKFVNGQWRVSDSGATTKSWYTSDLDVPTIGLGRELFAQDAFLFGSDPAALGSRMVELTRSAPMPSRGSQDEQVVIALGDTGINPYHTAFRDTSPLAYQHPSTYIDGYPADAIALPITLDETTLANALATDAALWASIEADKLYWFPGTKIVGGIASGLSPEGGRLVFSTGHGTMTASRAAANDYSLCPECRIVMMQAVDNEGTQYIRWAADQEWIDIQSHSWSGLIPVANEIDFPGVRAASVHAAAKMPLFASAGNGAVGKLGVLGHPAFTRPISGAPGVIPVGGHDNGFVTAWTAQYAYVVADACQSWAAVGSTLDEFDPAEGGGTSAATPYSAGEAGRLILEARRELGDAGDRNAGVLAQGAPRPDLGTSPLADGVFTLDELKSVLFRTATPRPAFTRDDGIVCGPDWTPSNTLPVAWTSVPTQISAYPLIGWGGIDVHSLQRGLDALHGAPMPVRPVDEDAHAHAELLRASYHTVEP